MLPSEVLAVWKRRGAIQPRYAKLSADNLELAVSLIETYKRRMNEKKSALKESVGELENRGYEYRFVRGLSLLLDRRSTFRCEAKLDPKNLRQKIYQATEKLGIPTTPENRRRIIQLVASELGTTTEAIEESLHADLDSELVLNDFNPPAPSELLKEYNLSLTQTLLFDSTELKFTTSGNWQRIFYAVKRFGLIYDAYKEDGFWVKIDGPASLFKLTRRYGTAIAKLLPVVVANPEWTVEAKILWKYTNEICSFKIESPKHSAFFKKSQPFAPTYDSLLEEDFAKRYQALRSDWHLRREPEPLLAGRHVIIPDFSLEREGIKVYLEVVGFWTAEYLLRKIQKLKKVDTPMLVAVNETLACEKLTRLDKQTQLNIIYYKDRIPLAPILRHLEETFKKIEAKQTLLIENLPIIFTESIINFKEFAATIGISEEAARAALTKNHPPNYTALPNSLIRKDKLKQIEKKIQERLKQNRLSLSEAARIVETEGADGTSNILEALGYKIIWHGINFEKAEVIKP